MHPWITSKEPGNCTICGMTLVPVYEGAEGLEVPRLPASTIQVIGVATVPVEEGVVEKTLRLAGTLDDDAGRHHVVSAYFEGRVDKPFIEQVGEEVRKGQPLAEIYSPDLLYAVREYQRARAAKDRGVGDVAARRLIQFGLAPGQLEDIAGQSPDRYGVDILSPITGTVIKRYVNSGQYVKTGEPLFELGDFSRMWMLAIAYESDLPFLKIGQKAMVATPASPDEVVEGVVTLIDPNFDPVTRSTTVRIEVPNPKIRTPQGERRTFPHQAFAEASVEVPAGRGLVVPRSAILDTGNRTLVYVDRGDGHYEPRPVRVAARGDSKAVISSGLEIGEKVVTRGNLLLDAEAQMRNVAVPSPSPTPAASTPPGGHRSSQPLDEFLTKVAAVGTALAHDNLAGYAQATRGLHAKLPALPPDSPAVAAWTKLDQARHLSGSASTLAEARAAYLPLSEAAADVVSAIRPKGSQMHVFVCPMTEDSFPGAPAKARWIQPDLPLRNPWFGQEMIECGVEVQP